MLDNRQRIYALASWTVKSNGKSWFVRKTDSSDEWRRPYRSEASACLVIARHLKKELIKRDAFFPCVCSPESRRLVRRLPFLLRSAAGDSNHND